MADNLLFKIDGDARDAVEAVREARGAILGELRQTATAFNAQGAAAGREFNAGLSRGAADVGGSLVRSLQQAQREGDGLFNTLTQLRIGLTQIGRGDIGGVPNLIKAYRDFVGVGKEAQTALKLLDAALVASGASSTKAADLFGEFGSRIKTALSGSGDEAKRLRQDFETLGISLTDAVLRPEQAFTRLLKNFGSAKQGSAEFQAGLNLLGTGIGSVEQAAGTAGRSMTQLGAGLGITAGAAVATGGAILIVVAAIAAVVVAVKAFEFAVKGIVDTAKEIGTKSKEDFEEFKKRIESAGFAVTQLDRNLSQGVVKALDQVKGASDGLFVQMVRATGPELITLLRSVAALLRDLAPLAEVAGRFIAAHFTVATAAVRTFQQLLALAKTDLLAFTLFIGDLPLVGSLFAANIAQAAKDAKSVASALPKATFDNDASKKATDATLERIRLLEIEERAAQRVFNEETAGAERAFRLRLIGGEELVARLTLAEKTLLAAKLRTIAAERQAVEDGSISDEKAATKRAELREKELQALSNYNQAIQKITDEAAQRYDDATRKALEDARRAAEARIRLLTELQRINQEIGQLQIEQLERNAEILERTPGHEVEVIEARTRVLAEQERLRSQSLLAELEFQKRELEISVRTAAEKAEIERAINQEIEVERSRHEQALLQIRIDALSRFNVLRGFDEGTALALAQQESLLGRQLTLSEQLRISLKATAQTMQATIPSAGAVLTQTFRNMSQAFAQSVAAFVSGQATARQAFGALVRAALQPLQYLATAKAAEQLAWALSDLASGNYGGAAKHFAAASAWGVLGGLVGALGNLAAGSGGASVGAGQGAVTGAVTGRDTRVEGEDRIRYFDQGPLRAVTTIIVKREAGIRVEVEKSFLDSYQEGGVVKQVLDNQTSGIAIGG